MKKLNKENVAKVQRPVKVFQFGEGNFLRAFVDWQLDIANEKGVMDAGIAMITPIYQFDRVIDFLKEQDGLYHVVLEGVENGKPKREIRLIKSVMDAFTPAKEPEKWEQYIQSPDVRFIVSNTTEAGIRYEEDDIFAPEPKTFPGKVTQFLYKRWQHFNGDPAKGLIFLCCELIEDNATHLHKYVIKQATDHNLPAEFIAWVDNDCIWCDTLVDRIVPGFPRDNINEIQAEIGFEDNLVDKGEFYHLWAIGGKDYEKVREELPLEKAGLHVLFMPSIKPYRDKKVRILNGSHTGMVPVALQLGCETVMDAFNNAKVNKLINDMVAHEVLPMIDEDPEELKAFAAGILERFYNPYIKHMLSSIALNSLSKWEARNYSTVLDTYNKLGRLAERELFTFAALMTLYSPGSGFTPDDNAEHVEIIRNAWDDNDYEATIRCIVESPIFIERFEEQVPGFSKKVAEYVADIKTFGMDAALDKFLG